MVKQTKLHDIVDVSGYDVYLSVSLTKVEETGRKMRTVIAAAISLACVIFFLEMTSLNAADDKAKGPKVTDKVRPKYYHVLRQIRSTAFHFMSYRPVFGCTSQNLQKTYTANNTYFV
jgi:hypothetical protein